MLNAASDEVKVKAPEKQTDEFGRRETAIPERKLQTFDGDNNV